MFSERLASRALVNESRGALRPLLGKELRVGPLCRRGVRTARAWTRETEGSGVRWSYPMRAARLSIFDVRLLFRNLSNELLGCFDFPSRGILPSVQDISPYFHRQRQVPVCVCGRSCVDDDCPGSASTHTASPVISAASPPVGCARGPAVFARLSLTLLLQQ